MCPRSRALIPTFFSKKKKLVALQCQSYLITLPKNGKSCLNLQPIDPITIQESVRK